MWKEDLKFIEKLAKSEGEKLNDGLTSSEYAELTQAVATTLNKQLPAEYEQVLQLHNGIEFDGYTLYGADTAIIKKNDFSPVDGILDQNEMWYEVEENQNFLFLGESGESWFVYDTKTATYQVLDSPSGSEIDRFNSLDELLDAFFEMAT